MKKMKKIFALLIAMVMVLGMSTSVFAAALPEGTKGAPKTITIKSPANVGATEKNSYTVYKVFDATNNGTSPAISYKLMSGVTAAPQGFTVDDAGNVYLGTVQDTKPTSGTYYEVKISNATKYVIPQTTELTDTQITAIKNYSSKEEVDTVEITGPNTEKTVTLPDYGYYFITTTSGTVVTIDSNNPSASVNDKNTITVVVKSAGTQYDKDSQQAIAAVGTNQPFTAQITKGKGAKNVIFTDTMTNMTYNGDVDVKVGGNTVSASTTINTDADNETFVVSGASGASSFTVSFDNDYIASLADNTVITLNYTGKITSDALSTNPATNTAKVTTGDNNNNSSTTEPVKVYNAKITVTKQDGSNQPLAGAGFVLKDSTGAYYKLNAATEDVDETAAATTASITWYTLGANETLAQAIADGKVTEYTSDAQGAVTPFTGLKDGTYTLVESTTPAGYNTAADENFTINGSDYTTSNLEKATTVINQSGTELPSTGGIGTTIFYIIGAILVIGAGVVLVTRRRMNAN